MPPFLRISPLILKLTIARQDLIVGKLGGTTIIRSTAGQFGVTRINVSPLVGGVNINRVELLSSLFPGGFERKNASKPRSYFNTIVHTSRQKILSSRYERQPYGSATSQQGWIFLHINLWVRIAIYLLCHDFMYFSFLL